MRIEVALDPTTDNRKRVAARTQIASELEYLRESCETWKHLRWNLRMLEAVIDRTDLGMVPFTRKQMTAIDSVGCVDTNPITQDQFADQPRLGDMNGLPATTTYSNLFDSMNDCLPESMLSIPALTGDVFGLLPIGDENDWLHSTFARAGNDFIDAYTNQDEIL